MWARGRTACNEFFVFIASYFPLRYVVVHEPGLSDEIREDLGRRARIYGVTSKQSSRWTAETTSSLMIGTSYFSACSRNFIIRSKPSISEYPG